MTPPQQNMLRRAYHTHVSALQLRNQTELNKSTNNNGCWLGCRVINPTVFIAQRYRKRFTTCRTSTGNLVLSTSARSLASEHSSYLTWSKDVRQHHWHASQSVRCLNGVDFKGFFQMRMSWDVKMSGQGDVDEVVWSMVVMETLARPFRGCCFFLWLYLMFCFVFVSDLKTPWLAGRLSREMRAVAATQRFPKSPEFPGSACGAFRVRCV